MSLSRKATTKISFFNRLDLLYGDSLFHEENPVGNLRTVFSNQAIVDILGTKKEPVHRQTLNVLSMHRLPLPVFTSNQVKDIILFSKTSFLRNRFGLNINQSSVSSSFLRKDSLQA
jgi:hypothetical protein